MASEGNWWVELSWEGEWDWPLCLITSFASKLYEMVLCLGRTQKSAESRADKLSRRRKRHLKLNGRRRTKQHGGTSTCPSSWTCCCSFFPISKASGITTTLSLSTLRIRIRGQSYVHGIGGHHASLSLSLEKTIKPIFLSLIVIYLYLPILVKCKLSLLFSFSFLIFFLLQLSFRLPNVEEKQRWKRKKERVYQHKAKGILCYQHIITTT